MGSPSGSNRADDVLALARLATKEGAVRAILDWLARRTGGIVALVGCDGNVLAASASCPGGAAMRSAATAVLDLHHRGIPSAVVGGDGLDNTVHLVCLGRAGEQIPYLAVLAPGSCRRSLLLADAARTLGLCWRLEEAERIRHRVESAEAHSREAVLHLLMIGSVSAAHRIAAALRPRLPDPARVYVVECPPHRRPEIADEFTRCAGGRAWIVPCPVRPRHLIALVPAGPGQLDELIAERVPGCRVGVSDEVPLGEAAVGYEQAFHALAVARSLPEGHARFGRRTDLAPFMETEGHLWARQLLAPCLSYTPSRRADPGADELLGTLGSWLSFGSAASRHLKIHRNTLAARLRLLDALLGLDLSSCLPDQAAAWLALRLHTACAAGIRASTAPGTLDGLLTTPAAAVWARNQLHPLEQANVPTGTETVRVWLRADAQLSTAAAALGISVPGVRKRLIRAEEALGRSLLHAPSAKYELWLAMRALGSL